MVATLHNTGRNDQYAESDIDVFVWGLTEEQSRARVVQLVTELELALRKLRVAKYTWVKTRNALTLIIGDNIGTLPYSARKLLELPKGSWLPRTAGMRLDMRKVSLATHRLMDSVLCSSISKGFGVDPGFDEWQLAS